MSGRIFPGLSVYPAKGIDSTEFHLKSIFWMLVLTLASGGVLFSLNLLAFRDWGLLLLADIIISARMLILVRIAPALLVQRDPQRAALLAYLGGWLFMAIALFSSLLFGKQVAISFGIMICVSEIVLVFCTVIGGWKRRIA